MQAGKGIRRGRAYPLLVKGDLFGEALLGEVAHSVVISICQEMRQLVLVLGILLHGTPTMQLQSGIQTEGILTVLCMPTGQAVILCLKKLG